MAQIGLATTLQVSPSSPPPQTVVKPAKDAAAHPIAKAVESSRDHILLVLNYGVSGAGSLAGMVAIPHQLAKNGPLIAQSVRAVGLKAATFSATRSGLLARVATGVAMSSSGVAKGTEVASGLAGSALKAPVLGRIFSPKVANVMTGKVLPTINLVGSGISILDNANRFHNSYQKGNTAGEVVAGAQIGLNVLSAVAGYLPGKGQWVAAGAGLVGTGLEIAHQAGGLGKDPQ